MPCMSAGCLHSLHYASHAVLPNVRLRGRFAREAPSRFGILRRRVVFGVAWEQGQAHHGPTNVWPQMLRVRAWPTGGLGT
jgi:hypothetical protein